MDKSFQEIEKSEAKMELYGASNLRKAEIEAAQRLVETPLMNFFTKHRLPSPRLNLCHDGQIIKIQDFGIDGDANWDDYFEIIEEAEKVVDLTLQAINLSLNPELEEQLENEKRKVKLKEDLRKKFEDTFNIEPEDDP